MIVKIKNQPGNFTIVSNAIILNPNLSWKAKGILLYCLSRPDDWIIHPENLRQFAPDGIESLQSGFRELRNHGFAHIQLVYENGKIKSRKYVIYEDPSLNKYFNGEKPHQGKSTIKKTAPINKIKNNNTEISNTVMIKKESNNIKSNLSDKIDDKVNQEKNLHNSSPSAQAKLPQLHAQTKYGKTVETTTQYENLKTKYKQVDIKKVLCDWEKKVTEWKEAGNKISDNPAALLKWFEKFLVKEIEFNSHNITSKNPFPNFSETDAKYLDNLWTQISKSGKCNINGYEYATVLEELRNEFDIKKLAYAIGQLDNHSKSGMDISSKKELKDRLINYINEHPLNRSAQADKSKI